MGEAEKKYRVAAPSGSGNVGDVQHEINPILTGFEILKFSNPEPFKSEATRRWDADPASPLLSWPRSLPKNRYGKCL